MSTKKESMGYNPKPIQRMCSNCVFYSSKMTVKEWGYIEEKEIRCSKGGFAVKKTANCNEHEFKH